MVAALLDPCQKNLDFLESEQAKSRAHEAFQKYYEDLFPEVAEYAAAEFQYAAEAVASSEVSRYLSCWEPKMEKRTMSQSRSDGGAIYSWIISEYLQNGVHFLGSACI